MGTVFYTTQKWGRHRRKWEHIILDGRQPHWAENLSDEDRIILYMEINQ